ncbi:hypothetical protein [Burkholderia sp. S171]|uniref:aromatic-ring hydroxylase C-terminal domain-containing protein n=1 Tax=Burkholderia sp. S171 TaxID=1641860 RepID=UPI0020B12E18|nr:hypothetical protein [Burkholderia sp. S171]
MQRTDDRTEALRETVLELLSVKEPRKRIAAEMSGLGIRYDLGEGHPLVGRRMPDLDLITPDGPIRVFTLIHDARPSALESQRTRQHRHHAVVKSHWVGLRQI